MILNSNYSTTRLVRKGKPIIMKKSEDKFETLLFLPEGENRQGVGGLRTKGYFKHSYEKMISDKEQGISEKEWWIVDRDYNLVEKVSLSSIPYPLLLDSYTSLPLISIITVVYNGEKYLEETIQSVINQTYPNVEYIIIDGGSTDGTIDIIKKYEDKIDYWVSEPDDGIYYAMNKGIDVVNGEWINFMGSDDLYYASNTVEKVFTKASIYNHDLIYGNVYMRPSKNKVYDGKFNSYKLSLKNICHQAIFYRRQLFLLYGKYNLRYESWADHEFNMRIFKKAKKKYLREVIAFFNDEGYSSYHPDKFFIDSRERLIKDYLGTHLYHLFRIRMYFRKKIRDIFHKY